MFSMPLDLEKMMEKARERGFDDIRSISEFKDINEFLSYEDASYLFY